MTVYLILVVILNFLVDFLLLLGTNRLGGFPAQPGRCAVAAGLGAAHSAACLVPGFSFLGNLAWRGVFWACMSATAFGWDVSACKRGGIYLLLRLAMGGLSLRIGRGQQSALLLAALGVWLLCRLGFGQGGIGREYIPITLHFRGQSLRVIALRDTGNLLRDPVTGEAVMILAGQAAHKLTGLTQQQLRSPLETLANRPLPGLRLIPFHAVGQSSGMLLAMRFDQVQIGNQLRSALVAFAAEGFNKSDMHQALTGGVL